MESKMLINDRTIKTDCDKNRDNNIKTTAPINIINLNIIHEKLNKSYSTSTTTRPMENNSTTTTTTTTHNDDHFNNETINGNSQKIEKFVCDFALMSFCGSNEQNLNDIKKDLENESDREQDDEIFYDSTTESEDYESDANRNLNDIKNEEETLNSNGEQNEGLSKLYLEDNEIVSKGEEQTVTEILNAAEEDKLMDQNGRLRVVFGVIFRLIYPLTNGLVQRVKGIKDVRFLKVVHYVASSRVALTDLFAYVANTIALNLSSVQVTNRIGPILKLLKIRVSRDGIESLPDSQTKLPEAESLRTPFPSLTDPTVSHFSREPRYSLPNFQCSVKNISLEEYEATTKCCTLNILAEPPADQPIRADIVFIHGLNGSLANTWKQGLWENERRPVEFQRPPKPAVRPPKRPRHSRTSALHPPHHKKRARFSHADVSQRYWHEIDAIDETDENNYSSMVSDSNCVQTYDDIEYSFPTFRLRIHDNGRLLQAEHDFNNKSGNTQSPDDVQNSRIVEKGFDKKPLKPSPNDPNYSKCWPGDWLPIDCPGVRVIALNYTTDPHLFRPLWKKKQARSNLIQRSREMMDLLIKYRVGYGHPIVWVGHSKGGLFIKQIIVDAWESGRPAVAPFWRSARGVFFYSVPHRGSHLASIRTPFLIRSVELIDIEKNNKYLLDLHRRFVGLYHLGHLKIEVFSFVETALTLMSLLYLRIVGVDSADPGIGDVCGIRLDHREICKPRNRDCILYKQLVDMINKVS